MGFEIQEEYERFIEDISKGSLSHGIYLREDDYQDEYSGNEIEDAQGKLAGMIKEYIHENHADKYCVFIDWCVRVMSIELAKERKVHRYELRIVH